MEQYTDQEVNIALGALTVDHANDVISEFIKCMVKIQTIPATPQTIEHVVKRRANLSALRRPICPLLVYMHERAKVMSAYLGKRDQEGHSNTASEGRAMMGGSANLGLEIAQGLMGLSGSTCLYLDLETFECRASADEREITDKIIIEDGAGAANDAFCSVRWKSEHRPFANFLTSAAYNAFIAEYNKSTATPPQEP